MNQLPDIATAKLPSTYESAKNALASCASLDECQTWADKAAALASYAKQADDTELENLSKRIRARAVRRAGELLEQIEGRSEANLRQNRSVGSDTSEPTRRQIAEQAGMSVRQQLNAVRVARVPQEEFEREIEAPRPATVTSLAKRGTMTREQEVERRVKKFGVDYMQGRTGAEYRAVQDFISPLEDYAKWCREHADIEAVLADLTDQERQLVRASIETIDRTHDRIITRL